jgi:hypothetical protein
MIFHWLRQQRRYREIANTEIDAHGPEVSFQIYYALSRDMSLPTDDRTHAQRIRRQIEKLTGRKPRLDTATRYLEEGQNE